MNKIEIYVMNFFKSLNIFEPQQLTIENLSESMNLPIVFWNYASEITVYKGRYKIFINESLCNRQRWQEFGHEIGHFLLHVGNQSNMNHIFRSYQEKQAEYFAYHFCVPTFMLYDLKEVDVYDVMNLFNVEFDFAFRRLEMYHNKIMDWRKYYERSYSWKEW